MESAQIKTAGEQKYGSELSALLHRDTQSQARRPNGWKLSPQSVVDFIMGHDVPVASPTGPVPITKKYIGNRRDIELCTATLASDRGLLMVGPPGTGKSYISEWLAAAISGNSRLILQGNSGVTEDQIKYSWNFSLLLQKGPVREALKPSPILVGMLSGQLVRFEEMTRCPQEVQDALISIMSEKEISVPEMGNINFSARFGFNIIATANTKDKGVHDLSSALKRRFNFVTIPIIEDPKLERQIVEKRVRELCQNYGVEKFPNPNLLDILVQVCQELRQGRDFNTGENFKPLQSELSTAEIISFVFNCAIHSNYFLDVRKGDFDFNAIAREFLQTIGKENVEARKQLEHFAHNVLNRREGLFKSLYRELQGLLK